MSSFYLPSSWYFFFLLSSLLSLAEIFNAGAISSPARMTYKVPLSGTFLTFTGNHFYLQSQQGIFLKIILIHTPTPTFSYSHPIPICHHVSCENKWNDSKSREECHISFLSVMWSERKCRRRVAELSWVQFMSSDNFQCNWRCHMCFL